MELYPFQRKALANLLGGKKFCIAGTGAGKTSIALHWAKAQNKPRVLVVTPASKRDSHDWENEADAWFPSWRQSLSSFFVISWQGLSKWLDANKSLLADYAVIFDECLAADTKVTTDNGIVEIADLKVGDKVLSYNHNLDRLEYKPITRLIKKQAPQRMYRLLLRDGTAIISTGNHPHYTQNGYVPTEDIKIGDILYAAEIHKLQNKQIWGDKKVPILRKRDTGKRLDRIPSKMFSGWKKLLLRQREMCVGRKERSVKQIDENKKPDEQSRIQEKSNGCKDKKWVEANMGRTSRITRGQWEIHRAAEANMGETQYGEQRLGNGTTSIHKRLETWLSQKLQIRHRKSVLQNRDRVRWGQPQLCKSESGRQKKRGEIRGIRVESIEVLKLRDIKRLGLYRDPDYVYCIDVADNHNFFANGVLTHNCHSAKAGISSQRGTAFLKIAANTSCWTGYTATPGDCWMDFYPYFCACHLIQNKTKFRIRFCDIETYKGFPEIVGYRETDTLKQWWSEIADTVDISEMLAQLPPETHKIIKFKAPKGYKEVLKTRTSREGEFLDTTMGLCCYLRQMCVDEKRLAYIADFIEGLGDRAVLFYNFIKEGEILEETIKKVLPKGAKVWRIDGRSHDIPTEQTCGKRDVILVQWQAGSMGLNLQFVQYWVSVSPNYSWTISTQARGRIKRIGQQKPMFFIYFYAEHTIEEAIYQCLGDKRDFAEDAWLEGEI